MRFQIRFNPEQAKVLDTLLEDIYARAIDMAPALKAVTYLYLGHQKALFEGDNTWAPLTPGTLATKERTGHMGMMVASGGLRGSLTLRFGSNRWASTTNTSTFALMGTKAPHAHLQALGTAERVRKSGGRTGAVTPRSMAFVDAAMVGEFYSLLENYLVSGALVPVGGGVAEVAPLNLEGLGT